VARLALARRVQGAPRRAELALLRRGATPKSPAIARRPTGSGGAGPSALLPLLRGRTATFVAAPRIWPRGAPNAAIAIPVTGYRFDGLPASR